MPVTAIQAINNYNANPNVAAQEVSDTAANIAASLDGLQTLTAANKLTSVSITGSTALSIAATQASRGIRWSRR